MGHPRRPAPDPLAALGRATARSRRTLTAAAGLAAVFSLAAGCADIEKGFRDLGKQIEQAFKPPPPPPSPVPEAPPPEPPPRLDDVLEEVQVTTDPSPELWPRVSPDGALLLFASQKTGNFELFALEIANPRLQYQLTTSASSKCRSTQSPDAKLLLFDRFDTAGRFSLYRMSLALAERRDLPLVDRAIHVLTPDLSVDGQRLAFALAELTADSSKLLSCRPPLHEALALAAPSIWVARPDGSGPIHLGRGFYPRWSRDGRKIAFVSLATGNADIWTINADGSELTQITFDPSDEIDPAWSPDGNRLVFASDRRTKGNFDLWMLDLRDSRLVQLTADPGHEGGPAWSPDGRHIYFHSFRNGNWDIYRVAPALR